MKSLTDITTLVAVQSLFESGTRDPWAIELAGKLADWYAYSANPQFILPQPADSAVAAWAPPVPGIVDSLQQRETDKMSPVPFLTGAQFSLADDHYDGALEGFMSWCRVNPKRLERWVALHKQEWALFGYSNRIPTRYLFDIHRVLEHARLARLSTDLLIAREDFAYAFDVALRYARYGELAGSSGVYLSHPLREHQQLPTMTVEPQRERPIALSFAADVSTLAQQLSLDEYSALLHEIRSLVQQRLSHLKPNQIEADELRAIASELRLPVYLRNWAKTTAVGAAVLTAVSAIPDAAMIATVSGAIVEVGALFLPARLPRRVGSWRWARWALHWPIEEAKS